jgi:DNA (cytosine-5)-methyltransferase 1
MRYFSLFSGIGGFELGIMKAYVEITNRDSVRRSKKNQENNEAEGKRLESTKGQGVNYKNRQLLKLPYRNNDKGAPDNLASGQSYENNRRKFLQEQNSKNVYEDSTNYKIRKDGPTCVGYSEIDKYAIQIYERHFNHKNYGDIRKIKARSLPDFDLLIGGFPCQSFSVAGKRRGFKDTRGTLFFEIARILSAKKPKLLLLENVKGLLSHDQGRTFATILSTLDGLGYDIQWEVLNSKNFGVPQNRERVFIVGHLRKESRPEIFSIEKDDRRCGEQHVPKQKATRGVRNMSDLKSRWRHTMRIRKLTPIECERLQGFPDGWTEGVSDTQRYKTLGNAVTVNVVAEIAKRIISDEKEELCITQIIQDTN